jgi:hypothetical protein
VQAIIKNKEEHEQEMFEEFSRMQNELERGR